MTAAVISRRVAVQHLRELLGLQALREIGEPDHVGEQHGDACDARTIPPRREARLAEQTLGHLARQEARELAGAHELGHLLVDARLQSAACLLELGDVVVQDVEAARLVLLLLTDREDLDVDKRPVLAGAPADASERLGPPRLVAPRGRFGVDLRILRDELVEVRADRLVSRVAEEALGSRVPQRDLDVAVHHDDRGGARLNERLEEPSLANQLADVLVQRECADEAAVDRDRHGTDRDVDEAPVLPGAAGHDLDRPLEDPVVQRRRLVPDGVVATHQVVDVASHRLRPCVTEQALGGRVPRRHDELRIACDDRRRTRLDQGLVVAPLVLGTRVGRFRRCGHRREA